MKSLLCLLAFSATLIAEELPKLLLNGSYYANPLVVAVDEKRKVASVWLDKYGEWKVQEVSLRFVPKEYIAQFQKPQADKYPEQIDAENRFSKEVILKRLLADPRHPLVVVGKMISRVSYDSAIVECDPKHTAGLPVASGTVFVRDYSKAGKLVDEDDVNLIVLPDGEYNYVASGGAKKVVRAYKAISY